MGRAIVLTIKKKEVNWERGKRYILEGSREDKEGLARPRSAKVEVVAVAFREWVTAEGDEAPLVSHPG